MAVDAAGQDELAGGVQLFGAAVERIAERHDAPVAHADVGGEAIGRGHHRASTDDEIEAVDARDLPVEPAPVRWRVRRPVLKVKIRRLAASSHPCARRP